MATFILGLPDGPVIVDGETRIQMVNDSMLEHQPAEVIPYLQMYAAERILPYTTRELLGYIIELHRRNLPPPEPINLEIVAALSQEKPTISVKSDRIPVPITYKRNRFRK